MENKEIKNIFTYASKELSQDAFLRWILVFIVIFVLSLLVLLITIFVRNNLSRKKEKRLIRN